MVKNPVIGITMGDPAGIGPEVIVKVLAERKIYDLCQPVVFGDALPLQSQLPLVSCDLSLNIIEHIDQAKATHGHIDLIERSELPIKHVVPGNPTLECGRAMVQYILRAVQEAKANVIDALVTCPINKALMQRAGYSYEGHTQLIAELTKTSDYVMMLAGERLRVALATIHLPIRKIPSLLSKEIIYKTIKITADALINDFGFKEPRLAVAALNPHAGEEGLFGDEEERYIRPAVMRAVDKGYRVSGPYPPDTVFYRAASGMFEAVVAMYHDQGLIPLKLLHFSDAVNITLGLPIIRTSVDHGTAYDIAGRGCADHSSLQMAIMLAAKMVRNRHRSLT